jgi:hypothetical protein
VKTVIEQIEPYDTVYISAGIYTGTENTGIILSSTGITIRGAAGGQTIFTGGTTNVFSLVSCHFCTIASIQFDNNTGVNGAALSIVTSAHVTMNNLIVSRNRAVGVAGSIYCSNSNLTISDSMLFDNGGSDNIGSGIYSTECSITFDFVTVRGHSSCALSFWGNGVYIFRYCLFTENITPTSFSVFWVSASDDLKLAGISMIMNHTIFRGNRAASNGGTMQLALNTGFKAFNTTWEHNAAGLQGGGYLSSGSGDTYLLNCTFRHNTAG